MNKKLVYFILAVAVQVLILSAVPAKQIYTRSTGELITIKTAPYDPYDFLSGYHVVLNYEISRPPGLSELEKNQVAYVILQKGPDGIWAAKSTHKKHPKITDSGDIVIKGRYGRRNRIQYGIESYFIPEKSRHEIEKDLRENTDKARADIKVDKFGNAALVRLRIEDRIYEY